MKLYSISQLNLMYLENDHKNSILYKIHRYFNKIKKTRKINPSENRFN